MERRPPEPKVVGSPPASRTSSACARWTNGERSNSTFLLAFGTYSLHIHERHRYRDFKGHRQPVAHPFDCRNHRGGQWASVVVPFRGGSCASAVFWPYAFRPEKTSFLQQ